MKEAVFRCLFLCLYPTALKYNITDRFIKSTSVKWMYASLSSDLCKLKEEKQDYGM